MVKRTRVTRQRTLDEETEKKMLRLLELSGIERIEPVRAGNAEEEGETRVGIFHHHVDNIDVMRMIAECEALEACITAIGAH